MQHLAEQLLAQAISEPGAKPFLTNRRQRLQQAPQQHHYHQHRQPLRQGSCTGSCQLAAGAAPSSNVTPTPRPATSSTLLKPLSSARPLRWRQPASWARRITSRHLCSRGRMRWLMRSGGMRLKRWSAIGATLIASVGLIRWLWPQLEPARSLPLLPLALAATSQQKTSAAAAAAAKQRLAGPQPRQPRRLALHGLLAEPAAHALGSRAL